jgi:hypothetical protein
MKTPAQGRAKLTRRAIRTLELPVSVEYFPAGAANPPALRCQRRAAAHKIVPGHTAGMVAESRGGGLAGRQFGEVDRACAGCQNTKQQARGKYYFHAKQVPSFLAGSRVRSVSRMKNPPFLCIAQMPQSSISCIWFNALKT